MSATDQQVRQVRVRLLLPTMLARMQQRGIDPDALWPVVELLIERHGTDAAVLETKLESLYHNWRRDPRMTLAEFARQTQTAP